MDQLADEINVSPRTLDKFMEGGEGLTFLQLRKLATFFGRGTLFFLDPEPVDEQRAHTAHYRTLTGQKPEVSFSVRQLIERVEKQRQLYLALREELPAEDHVNFRAPLFDPQDVDRAAAVVRQWLGLRGVSTFEGYREAVEAKGVLVFRSNGYAGRWQVAKDSSILGFSLYYASCPVIFVRKTQWEQKQTFTLMHELAHLLLHRESSIDDDADMHSAVGHERDANAFAGRLLVPDFALQQINDAARPALVEQYDAWLAPYRRAWGVSGETILRRLLDTGRLSLEQYRGYRTHVAGLKFEDDKGGTREYRHREPKHIFGKTFVKTVMGALAARQIPATKACAYLDGLKLTDLRQLERHLAGV